MPYVPYELLAVAQAEAASGGIFESLGINWQMLAFQTIGFAIVVAIFAKWVYPVFLRAIDEREAKIEESLEAAREASDNAANAQEEIDKQLATARREARDIVSTAKDEATAMLANANDKAKANAEHVLESAREEIAKETEAAKKALRNETIELVALATEKVVDQKLDTKADKSLISKSLEEAHK